MSHAVAFLLGGALGLVGMALICERRWSQHLQEWDHPGLGQSAQCRELLKQEQQQQQQQQQQRQGSARSAAELI